MFARKRTNALQQKIPTKKNNREKFGEFTGEMGKKYKNEICSTRKKEPL